MAKNKVVYVNPDGIKEALELLIDERDRYKEALEKILSVVGVGTTAARIASDALVKSPSDDVQEQPMEHDPTEFRHYRTEANSIVKVRNGRCVWVDFDWFEEENACCDCESDPDATRDSGFQRLYWTCAFCEGGSAALSPFTP